MNVDFGVEIARSFIPSGEVYETSTPAGEAAIAVHRGGYGDWSNDPRKLETTVAYLLGVVSCRPHGCRSPVHSSKPVVSKAERATSCLVFDASRHIE
jgi:hypothetical protein